MVPFFAIVFLIGITYSNAQLEWQEDPGFLAEKKALNCLLYAFFDCPAGAEQMCSKRALPKNIWDDVGAPVPDLIPRLNHFAACLASRDCMLYIIYKYSQSFGEVDCNCDGLFDYTDRLAIIRARGPECRVANIIDAACAERYNKCAIASKIPNRIVAITEACITPSTQ